MKKQLTAMLAISLMAMPFPKLADAENTVKVTIDGSQIPFEQPPMIDHDFTMVPMREIFENLEAEIEWNQETQTVTAVKNDVTIQMKIGSGYALKNYQQVQLDHPSFVLSGRTFVPLRFISETLGAVVAWDPSTKTVNITSLQKKMEEEAVPLLTFDDAVKWAQENSYDLRMAKQDKERSDINLNDANDALEFIPMGQGNGEDDAKARSALKKASASNINYFMSAKDIEVTKDKITYKVKQAYQDILLKQDDVKNKEESQELAVMEEQAALAKAEIGRISELEKRKIIKARMDAEKNLQMAKTTLLDAWAKLNFLMGKSKDSIFKLADRPTYSKMEDVDLNTHISRMIDSSPSIWLLEKQLQLAELDVNLFTFNAGQSYDLEKLDVSKAGATLSNSKRQMEESIRSMYVNLGQLQEQYNLLDNALKTAEESLSVAEAKYEKGLITALEVKKERFNVNQKRRQMEGIVIKTDQIRFTWDKPWVN